MTKYIKWRLNQFISFQKDGGTLSKNNQIYFIDDTSSIQQFPKKIYVNQPITHKITPPKIITTLTTFRNISIGDQVGILNLTCPTNPFIESIGICKKIEERYALLNDDMEYVFFIQIQSTCTKRISLCGKKIIPIKQNDIREVGKLVITHSMFVVKVLFPIYKNVKKTNKQTTLNKFFKKKR